MESDLFNKSISDQEWDCLYGHLFPDSKSTSIPVVEEEQHLSNSEDTVSSSSSWKLFNFLWGSNNEGIFGDDDDTLIARVENFERGHSYSQTYYGSGSNHGSSSRSSGSSSSSVEISPSLQRELDGGDINNDDAQIIPHQFRGLVETSSTRSSLYGGRNACSRSWDGLLCWPETFEGQSVTLPCFSELGGITYDERGSVTRFCEEGGLWQNKTNYSACVPKATNPTDTEAAGGTHDVYFVGYCISLFALTIAMVIFLVFKELRCLRNTIHTHLIITYILADALWIITSVTQSHFGQQTQLSCITFILLHYFHLTNFFWMFVEGLYLYVLVVQTFMAENVKFRVYASIGWGLPILIVITWAVAKWLVQPSHSSLQKLDGEIEIFTCFWLNVNVYDWIYKLPFIIVLAVNSIFLVQIMWVLITKLRSATSPETQQSRKAAKALVVLMPLLGITYVLVLRGSSQTPLYEIVRAVLISTQGFLVALLYCFLNGEVRIALRHRWNRLRAMGSGLGCCEPRQMHSIRDWSPRSRTESIRLYTPTQTPTHKKRESIASETTMTTVMGPSIGPAVNGSNSSPQSLIVTSNPSRKLSTTTTRTYNSTDNNLL